MTAWLSKLSSLINLSGLKGWLIKQALRFGGSLLAEWLKELERKAKRSAEQEKAKQEMDKVNADPDKSAEDRAKAYENYINSGR
ncbi:MAG TPA: hypothetical protein PK886_03115 [Candidatus Paceibacterota bacterium]|nr:hypothetical protein [Candidatus Paceibacterota bacterium]